MVLLGDVGVGKSTIVEKCTGGRGLSSASPESFTRNAYFRVSACGALKCIDVPGANAMVEPLKQNMWIAHAFNHEPVSLILLTVKADVRIDQALDDVRQYVERFEDFMFLVTVCVTHMDTVKWCEQRFLQHMSHVLGINDALFVGKHTDGGALKDGVLQRCGPPCNLTIDSSNFLRYFRIHDSNFRILRSVRDEVGRFKSMNEGFLGELQSGEWSEGDQMDMVFEFQAFMLNEVYAAQRRVSERNGFDFHSPNTANEAGHIASLTNQLRSELHDVRVLALAYQTTAGFAALRRCPWCGQIWTKVEGCDGETTCGHRMGFPDGRPSMATFEFLFDGTQLHVRRRGSRPVAKRLKIDGPGAGCGRTVAWDRMAPVRAPPEISETVPKVNTDDVALLPQRLMTRFADVFNKLRSSFGALAKTTQ